MMLLLVLSEVICSPFISLCACCNVLLPLLRFCRSLCLQAVENTYILLFGVLFVVILYSISVAIVHLLLVCSSLIFISTSILIISLFFLPVPQSLAFRRHRNSASLPLPPLPRPFFFFTSRFYKSHHRYKNTTSPLPQFNKPISQPPCQCRPAPSLFLVDCCVSLMQQFTHSLLLLTNLVFHLLRRHGGYSY